MEWTEEGWGQSFLGLDRRSFQMEMKKMRCLLIGMGRRARLAMLGKR